MTAHNLGTVTFSAEDHKRFAALSGDWNPMHMDPMAARRTQFGVPVVHGIHTVLRALETLAASMPNLHVPLQISAKFMIPIYIGDVVTIQVLEQADRQMRLQAQVDDATVADLRITLGETAGPLRASRWERIDGSSACQELSLQDMNKRSGVIVPAGAPEEIETFLPYTSKWLGTERVCGLMCLSHLVGMDCPGLHSLFSRFAVAFTKPEPSLLRYQVTNVDKFRLLTIDVDGLGLKGNVQAFARHPPIRQASIKELSTVIRPQEFDGQRALIIGGSRGLGELTAKLLAAGGGHPIITYSVGQDDAERVAKEIKQSGAECEVFKYDVCNAPTEQLRSVIGIPTYLYYFPTCAIFGRRTKEFDRTVFSEFLKFYVEGFHDLCVSLRRSSNAPLSVFYPSSVAVEERPRGMTEYAMAKAAGEILCADLNRFMPSFHITASRLPRLLTDQTMTVMPVKTADSVDTIAPIVRAVQGYRFDA